MKILVMVTGIFKEKTMKYLYLLLDATLLFATLHSCSVKEEDFQHEGMPGEILTIHASLVPVTKTTVNDGGTNVYWEADESIKVFNKSGVGAEFRSLNTEPEREASFSGKLNYTPGDRLVALYPWTEQSSFSEGAIQTDLTCYQNVRPGSFSKDINLSVAESTSLSMNFQNVCGGVRFTLSRDDIRRIEFSSIGGEPLSGTVRIYFENGVPKIQSFVKDYSYVFISPLDEDTFQQGIWYYVVLPPGELSKGLRITFETIDGKKGVAESTKSMIISRSFFLSKESLDGEVKTWEESTEEEMAIQEASIDVNIPDEADDNYIAALKLSNFYGEQPLVNSVNSIQSARRIAKRGNGGETEMVFNANYSFLGDGPMFQFLNDADGEMVMCCVSLPGQNSTINAESTAITLLLATPYLLTSDPVEVDFIIKELKELDEFKHLVAQIRVLQINAMNQCKAPDYSTVDYTPVLAALIKKFWTTPDSIDGIDIIDINKEPEKHSISLKIRNTFRRCIHVYASREWYSEHNTVMVRNEDICYSLEDVLNKVLDSKNTSALASLFISDDELESVTESAKDVYEIMRKEGFDLASIPFPYTMTPEKASYLKIVWGSVKFWDRDLSMPAESTSDELVFDLGTADRLHLDVYGIGMVEDWSSYDDKDLLRFIPVFLQGAVNDFIVPLYEVITGIQTMQKLSGTDSYKYDLRYGARKAPMRALLAKLQKNYTKEDAAKMLKQLSEGDFLGAAWSPCGYVLKEIFGNNNSEDKRTYHNLIYNVFKNAVGKHKMPVKFRDWLKKIWNEESHVVNTAINKVTLIGTTVKVSEKGTDLFFAIKDGINSNAKTQFSFLLNDKAELKALSPAPSSVITGDKIDLVWSMEMGNLVGGVAYDVQLWFIDGTSTTTRIFADLTDTRLTINLGNIPRTSLSCMTQYQITAHHPENRSTIYARSEKVPIYLIDYYNKSGAIDMGTSVQWAATNLGANSATEVGDYYSWGELMPKNDYTWANYTLSEGTSDSIKKYNTADGMRILLPEDDVANVTLKGNWRMATVEEWEELLNASKKVEARDADNHLLGYMLISNVNGNIIYLPSSGYMDGSQCINEGTPRYWWSSMVTHEWSSVSKARNLNEGSYYSRCYHPGDDKYLGMQIRPVLDERANGITPSDPVDLGLSVNWSSVNIGANNPESLGGYFSWGETSPKAKFTWDNYLWRNESSTIIKYNNEDGLRWLLREDDPTYQQRKGSWRMPTAEEWNELKDNCDWNEVTKSGRRGYIVKSRINGNSIFLPMFGYMEDEQLKGGISARYWSSSLCSPDFGKANDLCNLMLGGDDRYLGMPIRPIYDKAEQSHPLTPGEYIDMGLAVDWASCNVGATSPEETGGYYAWAELETKEEYTWDNYKFGRDQELTKYNSIDFIRIMERDDDVVFQLKGGKYRIPTKEEWDALWRNCTYEFIRINGLWGYYLKSKVNGNTLFLPAPGLIDGNQRKDGMQSRYWASDMVTHEWSSPTRARNLNEGQYYSGCYHPGDDRYLGMPVRGIYAKYEKEVTQSEKVDLGLSVEWASCNINVERPEDIGYYYAWGETEPKDTYNWDNYVFHIPGTGSESSKYNDDGRMYLDWDDDIVHRSKGGNWRMPTIEEWEELKNECEWEETTRNGVHGYWIVSKTNGNSIFLPGGGYKDDIYRKGGTSARYWSLSASNQDPSWARNLNETLSGYNWYLHGDLRCYGMPVRGVYDSSLDDLNQEDFIDMGNSLEWARCNIGAKTPDGFGIYFGWGEVGTHQIYSWENYSLCIDGTPSQFSKYNSEDNLNQLELIDDAAYIYSSFTQRMPTKAEWDQLMENCASEFKIMNGRPGVKLTSRLTGNKMFLPAAGCKDGDKIRNGSTPQYWSSSLTDNINKANALNETRWYSHPWWLGGDDRYIGMPVRGVKK